MRKPTSLRLTVHLLGPLDVRLDGEPLLRLHVRKAHWLLALLTLRHGREAQRAGLAELLWPEQALFEGDLVKASESLRHSVAHLRKVLGSEAARLQAPSPRTLSLDVTGAEVDVFLFDESLKRGDSASLQRAVDLYRGPLLEGCPEVWILEEREKRQQAYLQALETLSADARPGRWPSVSGMARLPTRC